MSTTEFEMSANGGNGSCYVEPGKKPQTAPEAPQTETATDWDGALAALIEEQTVTV